MNRSGRVLLGGSVIGEISSYFAGWKGTPTPHGRVKPSDAPRSRRPHRTPKHVFLSTHTDPHIIHWWHITTFHAFIYKHNSQRVASQSLPLYVRLSIIVWTPTSQVQINNGPSPPRTSSNVPYICCCVLSAKIQRCVVSASYIKYRILYFLLTIYIDIDISWISYNSTSQSGPLPAYQNFEKVGGYLEILSALRNNITMILLKTQRFRK